MTYTTTLATTLQLFDLVVLNQDFPIDHLRRGEIGTVVEVFDQNSDRPAYEVEFIDDEGQPLALVTLTLDQLLPLTPTQYHRIQRIIQDLKALYAELDHTYPGNPTMVGIKTLERIETNPSLKQRITKAGKEAGLAAIEAALDHPAVTITMAGIKGFVEG
ncbi:DUF4926 domain-containing protein [Prochlorothrix hollandica]|uniref:DUF4926 domain-containing protein n=1 Tax=Prochlorothrix hollandica TaxID=1223 RepID=UPI003340B0D8